VLHRFTVRLNSVFASGLTLASLSGLDRFLHKITEKYSSFSELVSTSLELLIEKNKKEQYKKAMIEASKDKLYLKDMEDIENDFKYVDFEEK
jgi:hypothetical protein